MFRITLSHVVLSTSKADSICGAAFVGPRLVLNLWICGACYFLELLHYV
jgi:hypothetical protein